MRSSILWLVPAALVSVHALAEGSRQSEKEIRTIKASASAGQPLTVSTRNGGVTVVRSDTDQIVVTAELHAKTKDDLAKIEVHASNLPDKGSAVHVKFPDSSRVSNMGCSLKIEVPRVNGLNIESTNGPIDISDMAGRAVLETTSGPVTITKHDGAVVIETNNAPVQVTDVAGAVAVETTNGPVDLKLHETATEKFVIATSNAPVDVSMPKTFNGVLAAGTSNGSISFPTDADLNKKPSSRGHGEATGQATFGKGGPVCTIETSNGSVQIRYRGDRDDATKKRKPPSTH